MYGGGDGWLTNTMNDSQVKERGYIITKKNTDTDIDKNAQHQVA